MDCSGLPLTKMASQKHGLFLSLDAASKRHRSINMPSFSLKHQELCFELPKAHGNTADLRVQLGMELEV